MTTELWDVLELEDMAFLGGLAGSFDEEVLARESYMGQEAVDPDGLPLTPNERAVLTCLTRHASDGGMVVMSLSEMVKRTLPTDYRDRPLTPRERSEVEALVREALDGLLANGLILKRTRKLRGANGYLASAYFLAVKVAA